MELRDAAAKIDQIVEGSPGQELRAQVRKETDRIRAVADGLKHYGLQEPRPMTDRILRAFTYQPPKPDQVPRYNELRDRALDLAKLINRLCPDSPEKSTALAKLSEVVMWANAAIARNE